MGDKKKIVLLSAFYEPFMSGAEQQPREIIKRLGNKYVITLIAARLEKKLPRREEHNNYTYIRVGIGHKAIDKILYPLLAALAVRQIKPAIAHANMESYAGIALAWLKIFAPKVRRILTLQSGNIDSSAQKKNLLIKLFWRSINFSPHSITAISRYLADRSRKLGVVGEKIRIIPNGVDLSAIPPALKPVKNRVFFAGRLSWEKGAEYMIKAWPKVVKKIPNAKLIQVGNGGMKDEILKLAADLGVKDSIKLKPTMPHSEYIKEFKQAEIMVCPSLAEGLGIAFIEAQACGTPVIGTNVGGILDVIQNNENGLLIEPKNSNAIADAIIRLLTDKELANRLRERAFETVKRFDWENIIHKFDEIYQKA
ncbi:MAG: glycosyltransferase family 4 protein [Patescibacteria group bacterium]|nr:glycosyltransferase family 4 protein [Patescibacteria group bacterium]